MNPLDLLRRRRDDRRTDAAAAFWRLIVETAAGMHTNEAAAAGAAERLDALAHELRIDVEAVEAHVATVRELRALGDVEAAQATLRQDAEAAHERLQQEAREWERATAARRTRGEALHAAWQAAIGRVQSNSTARQRAAELRAALEAAGAPATIVGQVTR